MSGMTERERFSLADVGNDGAGSEGKNSSLPFEGFADFVEIVATKGFDLSAEGLAHHDIPKL